MAHSPSAEQDRHSSSLRLDATDEVRLLDIAERTIIDGFNDARDRLVVGEDWSAALRSPAACFVTLEVSGELNGCIGSIHPTAALGLSVARHAHAAAFEDPRLPPLQPVDWDHLGIEISVLSPLQPIPARTRGEVTDRLRPGIDGLVLTAGGRVAVFLPSVWERLDHPDEFVDRLWYKAGIRPHPWPSPVEAARFTVHTFERSAGAA
jgi:AmmeMemoRadiSam system protein A